MSAVGWSEFVNIVEYEDGEDAHYITIRMGEGGVLRQSVEVGQTYTYAVNADEGWEVNTLTFDGKDMTSMLMDGQFSTPVIIGNAELNVVFRQTGNSVKGRVAESNVKVCVNSNTITVKGAKDDAPVEVYSINGVKVTSSVGNASISLQSGAYIVRVGNETFKVRL
ncbi:MAG: T9SS type A sorting domain-containing protein [Bacteroidaceae bacterium]|nr:T9SS type A sorting domain-containing protein [Bacteroidaceae bacterium]